MLTETDHAEAKAESEPEIVIDATSVAEEEPTGLLDTIEGGEELRAAAEEMAESFEVRDYTAPGTELNHGHDRDKHDVRNRFNVNDELVENFFHYDPADHAAPHELMARKEEFIESDVPVFSDTHDSNQSRWNSIKSTCSSAPIPDEAHRTLDRISR